MSYLLKRYKKIYTLVTQEPRLQWLNDKYTIAHDEIRRPLEEYASIRGFLRLLRVFQYLFCIYVLCAGFFPVYLLLSDPSILPHINRWYLGIEVGICIFSLAFLWFILDYFLIPGWIDAQWKAKNFASDVAALAELREGGLYEIDFGAPNVNIRTLEGNWLNYRTRQIPPEVKDACWKNLVRLAKKHKNSGE